MAILMYIPRERSTRWQNRFIQMRLRRVLHLRFAGSIDKEDLLKMSQAIEDDCERINSDEW